MTPDNLFSTANIVALLAWVLLAALPGKRWVAETVTGTIVPALLAAVYVAIVATTWASSTGSFSSLSGVAMLFSHQWILLGGWIHYLAFDLLIGLWEREEAARIGLARGWLLPCQLLTFLFGPIGWLAFMAVRWLRLRGGRATSAGGPSPRVLAL